MSGTQQTQQRSADPSRWLAGSTVRLALSSSGERGRCSIRSLLFPVLSIALDSSPAVQAHIVRVYATLALTLLGTVVGVLLDLRFQIGGSFTALCSLGCIIALALCDKQDVQKRVSILAAYGAFQGASLGPLIALAHQIDPTIVLTAALGSLCIFACFSLSAIYSPKRSYLYLGGMLASALSFMALLSFVNLFVRTAAVWNSQIYFGLAVFSCYVLYDTQLIISKAEAGSADFVGHALELFIDLVAIFVRILIILMQNAEKKNGSSKKEKKSESSASGSSARR